MQIRIRKVQVRDHATTRQLVFEAFKGNEPEETALFLDALRADSCILGEWLIEDVTGAVAHIVFSRVYVERFDGTRVGAAMLTPLAVRPDRQRTGLGLRLMQFAIDKLEAKGEALFFVLGHPSYYPRAGFRSDLAAGVECPWGIMPAFMARGHDVPTGKLILPKSIAEAH
jgi:putative acetyltransferase